MDSVPDGEIPAPQADASDVTIPGGPTGEVSLKLYRPAGTSGALPVVLYTHGAGWVFGDAHTHDRLVRERSTRSAATSPCGSSTTSRPPRATRRPPAQWLLGRRPEQARQQLATSPDLGIAAIAHRCAFPDASHFSLRLREALGATPREWRADNAGP